MSERNGSGQTCAARDEDRIEIQTIRNQGTWPVDGDGDVPVYIMKGKDEAPHFSVASGDGWVKQGGARRRVAPPRVARANRARPVQLAPVVRPAQLPPTVQTARARRFEFHPSTAPARISFPEEKKWRVID